MAGLLEQVDTIGFHQPGDASVLQAETRRLSEPAANEVQIQHKAVGVNFVDTYYRSGLYPAALPSGLGTEAAGIVTAVGRSVTAFKPGDRVAYAQGPLGAYASGRNIPAEFVVKLPDDIAFDTAAAVLLKGLTVYYLFHQVYPLQAGQTILFHAAAGGVGLLACQWAKHLGVKLIATVSNAFKAETALAHGAWQAINYSIDNTAEQVKSLTDGQLLPVVYDSIGQATWTTSLNCLAPRGLMVSFGNASGPVTDVALSQLSQKGSLYVTRPVLAHYMTSQASRQQAADQLFALVRHGSIKVTIAEHYALADAALAHQALLNRDRIGGIILTI